MTRTVVIAILISLLVVGFAAAPAHAEGGTYTVKPGDTLLKIARTYNINVSRLAAANGMRWNSWVYSGQQLVIPGSSSGTSSSASTSTSTNSGGTYVVQRGDTLSSIARRHGVSVTALRAANNLGNTSHIVSGQRLAIPDGSSSSNSGTNSTNSQTPAPPAGHGAAGEKWIDVNLSTQTLVAYEGQTPVHRAVVSTGTSRYPTVVGTYRIYVKYRSARMRGGYGADYYDLPNVPHVMYFYRGYGLHGTYWHNNFGTPMSHGCVNLTKADAKWVYNWAPVGTKVVTHY